jgi:hypothetical protein
VTFEEFTNSRLEYLQKQLDEPIRIMQSALTRSIQDELTEGERDRLLSVINFQYETIQTTLDAFTASILPGAYNSGVQISIDEMKRFGNIVADNTRDMKAINTLIADAQKDFRRAIGNGQEAVGDFFKYFSKQGRLTESEISNAVAKGLIEQGTGYGAKQFTRKAITDRGIQIFDQASLDRYVNKKLLQGYSEKLLDGKVMQIINKNGKVMNFRVNTYADLVSRTRIGEAQVQGTIDIARKNGIKLFKVTKHNTKSEICRPHEGQILSTDKNDPKYDWINGTGEQGESNRPVYHPNCLSKDTEIYTSQGWVLCSEITKDQIVMSLDPNTLNLEFLPIVKIHKQKHERLLHFQNISCDFLFTFNHRMFYQSQWDARFNKKRWQFAEAQEFKEKSSKIFYRSSDWQSGETKEIRIADQRIDFSDYCKLMGWYLSEGSVDNYLKRVVISQSKQANPEKYEMVHSLLDKIGIQHSCQPEGLILPRKLYDYFKQFGKSFDKFIPDEIMNAPKEDIRNFLDAFVLGDGNTKKGKFWKGYQFRDSKLITTSSRRMADSLGELIIKAGYSVTYKLAKNKGKSVKHWNGTYVTNYDQWHIYINDSQKSTMQKMKVSEVYYNDFAYCVSLPKFHTIFIRRNGRTLWTGNCLHRLMPYVDTGDFKFRPLRSA